MPVTINYLEEISSKKIASIKVRYARNESCYTIGKAVGLAGGIINKILIQTGCYDPYRYYRSAFYVRDIEFSLEPFSSDEMDYGSSGQSKYTYESLSSQEQKIYNKI
jgi:hypothetical protein|tara:strand:- start:97 stop:417 length:321 start_codon:yes stop_codon:yes gene_type:complete